MHNAFCKELFAKTLCSCRLATWNAPPSRRTPQDCKRPEPPGPAADARAAAHRGPGDGHHAGRPARTQHRRDVLPPAPAGAARLRRSRTRSAATAATAGGGRRTSRRAPTSRDARTRRRAGHVDAYLQTVAIVLHRAAAAGGGGAAAAAARAWREAATFSDWDAPADPAPGQGAGRGAAETIEDDARTRTTRTPRRSSSTLKPSAPRPGAGRPRTSHEAHPLYGWLDRRGASRSPAPGCR